MTDIYRTRSETKEPVWLPPPAPPVPQRPAPVGVFFRLALPTLWLGAMLVSWRHPGDEYGLFVLGALPGMWVAFILKFTHLKDILIAIGFAGAAVLFVAGWLLDLLRAWRWLWIPLFVVVAAGLVLWSLSEFPSYERAMAKNGSIGSYVSAGINVSLYLTSALVLLLASVARGIRALRAYASP